MRGTESMWRAALLMVVSALAGLGGWLLAAPADAAPCPNEAFRTGTAANLPDCRAYELVTPPDMNGRMPWGISGFDFEFTADLFPTELASPNHGSVVFETVNGPLTSPPEPNGSFDIYEAQRFPQGWQAVRRITPGGPQSTQPTAGGVSSDHRYAFVNAGLVAAGEQPGGSLSGELGTDYLGKPDGSFQPVGIGSLGEEPLAQGRYISEGGKHVIFSTGGLGHVLGQSVWCFFQPGCQVKQLEPNAAPEGTGTIYDREADGPTHVVSLLPGNVQQAAGQNAFYQGASKDGTSIAFKIGSTLYVRINSGKAGEETIEAAEGNPVYAGLSEEGKYLFYVTGGEKGTIHRLNTESKKDVAVNPTAEGEVVNVSADGSHVYFISKEQISGLGTAGQPNLYDWDESGIELVATVAPSDLERTSGTLEGIPALTRWTSWAVPPNNAAPQRGPGADSSRTTPDGNVLVFESKAKLDPSYENAGHTEIYRYDDASNELTCVSCNFGTPATADARLQELVNVRTAMVIHNLSDDGSRVFFETPEALASADTDGVNDIYEWTEGVGTGPELISSGHSVEYPTLFGNNVPFPNELYGVTPDGNDVVFLSQDDLTGGGGIGGAPALYDARVGGGFPPPPPPPAPCVEEGCKGPDTGVAPNVSQNEKSSSTKSSGNVKPKRKRRCHSKNGKKAGASKHCSKRHRSHKQGRARISSANAAAGGDEAEVSRPSAGSSTPQGSDAGTTQPQAPTPVAAATGEFSSFGIEALTANLSTPAAGQHPDFTTSFKLNYRIAKNGEAVADARPQDVSVALPPGLLGNPNAIPVKCGTGELDANGHCPVESQVGVARVRLARFPTPTIEPLYAMTPPHPDREIARFGFLAIDYPVFIDVNVRTASDFGVTVTVHNASALVALLEAETTIWGNPSDPIHDPQRLNALEAPECSSTGTACKAEGGKREVPRTNLAFLSNPSACEQGNLGLAVVSYQLPGQLFTKEAPLPAITDCTGLPFSPSFSAEPTSHRAGAPTGLQTKLVLPQHLGASEPATATMREARVTLPEGMGVNPEAANWIQTCSEAQVGYHQEVDASCPNGSKLGTAIIKSPELPEPIEGAIYQRQPTPGHQLGLWLVADALGLHIKLPGELVADNKAGRATAVFRDLPQVPVEEIDLNVWGGPRAPLTNPASCGTYQTNFSFAPHSDDPAVTGQAPMQINEGCSQPFDPKLKAGTTHPVAAKHSSLIVDLERPDGDQALRGFELKLPDGLLAKIKGVGRCTEAQAAAGSCPASSKLGTVAASAGSGGDPLWIPQPGHPTPGVYLGGPYQGSPLSIITLVPAQAGPFDLGTLA
ncbi:MAG: hypothetical protein ACTHKT_01200, partial [Solirubrobacterales bacterium]